MARWIDRLPGPVPSARSKGLFGNLTLLNKTGGRHRQSTNVVGKMGKQTVRDGINDGQRYNEDEAVCASGGDEQREG